jgi:hypothetical protein
MTSGPLRALIIFALASLVLTCTKKEELKPVTIKSLPPALIKASVDKASASTFDTITYSIRLDTEPSLNLVIPETANQIKGLRVVDFDTDGPKTEDNRKITGKWYKLQADISGSYILPAIEIAYTSPEGKKETIKTSEIFLEIKPPVSSGESAKDAKDIRDIKNIEPMGGWSTMWLVALGALSLAIAAVGTWIYVRRTRRPKTAPIIPPHEIAYRQLRELEQSGLLEKEDFKPYHFSLSTVARTYVENRFSLPVTDMTIEQIRDRIKEIKELGDIPTKNYLAILEASDRVKFTDFKPTIEESKSLLKQTETFVGDTTPVSKAEPEAVI